MIRSAVIEGPYRYILRRAWTDELLYQGARLGEYVCWVMLNPSTADDQVEDQTLSTCIRMSQAWGFGGLIVVNLFALRTKSPSVMKRSPDPTGPRNADFLLGPEVRSANLVVAAWGADGRHLGAGPAAAESLRALGILLHRLKPLTKNGQPTHPLYKVTPPWPTRW